MKRMLVVGVLLLAACTRGGGDEGAQAPMGMGQQQEAQPPTDDEALLALVLRRALAEQLDPAHCGEQGMRAFKQAPRCVAWEKGGKAQALPPRVSAALRGRPVSSPDVDPVRVTSLDECPRYKAVREQRAASGARLPPLAEFAVGLGERVLPMRVELRQGDADHAMVDVNTYCGDPGMLGTAEVVRLKGRWVIKEYSSGPAARR